MSGPARVTPGGIAPARPGRNARLSVLLFGAAGLAAGWLVFGQGLDNHFVSDDWVFLYQASQAGDFAGWLRLLALDGEQFYRPAQRLATWALFRGFGLAPQPYHLASLLLHSLNAALFFALALRLARAAHLGQHAAAVLATAAALLFWLNWRHHEAVFWFSSINEPLSAMWRLTALLLAAAWYRGRPGRWVHYILCLGAFALALTAKESAAALPLELGLLMLFWRQARMSRWSVRQTGLALAPFAALLAGWAFAYLASAGPADGLAVQRSGLAVVQAEPWEWVLRSIQYLDGHYLGGTLLARSLPLLIAQLAALGVLILLAFRARRGLWLFSLAWTIAAASPNAAIVPAEVATLGLPVLSVGVFGDRYLYYSSAGAGLLLAASLDWLAAAARARLGTRWVGLEWAAAGVLVVGLLGANAARLHAHEQDWDAAGQFGRSLVERAVNGLGAGPGTICLVDLPDSYRGKYVFRNGIEGALRLARPGQDLNVRLLTEGERSSPPPDCTYVLE